jgi:predicted lipoprotein with Yx(FWY)xxD motif
MTLYYFTADTQMTSACGSGCTGTWPPLLQSGSSQPASVASLSGKLTAVADTNGQQVQYNGHFLYTYAGDSAAGQTNGEGIDGKWFVATASLS